MQGREGESSGGRGRAGFSYATNTSIEAIADRCRRAQRVLVTTHAKPDGDALGSVLAVVRALAAIGVAAEGWVVGPFEPNLLGLAGGTPIVTIDPKAPRLPDERFDLVVVVDTGAWTQLETLAPWLRPRTSITVGLDHHARGDEVAAARVIDVSSGSATAIVARLVDALGVPLASGGDARGRGSIAEALFLGLATDTGWFRFQNAKPPEFALASRLLAAGVDKDRLVETIENSHRPERLKIEARALGQLAFLPLGSSTEDEVALMRLSLADFAATGARPEETSGVVNLPMAVASVRASVLLVETEPGLVKVSFRSKPEVAPDPGRRAPAFLDVNALAARFGGGGHVHAAGARIKGSLDQAEAEVRAAISG